MASITGQPQRCGIHLTSPLDSVRSGAHTTKKVGRRRLARLYISYSVAAADPIPYPYQHSVAAAEYTYRTP